MESSKPESTHPPVVYDSHIEPNLYSFIPLIFSTEQTVEEEVPVNMPIKYLMRVLNRGAYSVPNPPQALPIGFARSTPSALALVPSATASSHLSSSMNQALLPHHKVWYAYRHCPLLQDKRLMEALPMTSRAATACALCY